MTRFLEEKQNLTASSLFELRKSTYLDPVNVGLMKHRWFQTRPKLLLYLQNNRNLEQMSANKHKWRTEKSSVSFLLEFSVAPVEPRNCHRTLYVMQTISLERSTTESKLVVVIDCLHHLPTNQSGSNLYTLFHFTKCCQHLSKTRSRISMLCVVRSSLRTLSALFLYHPPSSSLVQIMIRASVVEWNTRKFCMTQGQALLLT
jgi:hypothetical protein